MTVMAERSWEQCVREVTLSADAETVGSVGLGWHRLSTALGYLRDELVGGSVAGPADTQRAPGGLPGMLAGWKGSGGEAYREHLGEIGKGIEELIATAREVSGALSRIEGDLGKAVAGIPIPVREDFGPSASLPNGTALEDAGGFLLGASAFLAALRRDYGSDPAAYADGAFRDRAEQLNATTKLGDTVPTWEAFLQLNNWYEINQQAANDAMSPLPPAVQAERPSLVVAEPDKRDSKGGRARDDGTDSAGSAAGSAAGHPGGAYGSSLAGVGGATVTGARLGPAGAGGGVPHPLNVLGPGAPGPGAGGPGGGPGGGIGAAAIPGMIGGGNGRVPPMTSAAGALRKAGGGPKTGPAAMPGGQESMGYVDPPETDRLAWSATDDLWGAHGDTVPGVLR